jgi:hypothetical protein
VTGAGAVGRGMAAGGCPIVGRTASSRFHMT